MLKKVDYAAGAAAIIAEFGLLEADVRAVAVEAMEYQGNPTAYRFIETQSRSVPINQVRAFIRAAWCLLKVERAARPKRAAGPRCFCPACVDARERKARKAAAAAAIVNAEGNAA